MPSPLHDRCKEGKYIQGGGGRQDTRHLVDDHGLSRRLGSKNDGEQKKEQKKEKQRTNSSTAGPALNKRAQLHLDGNYFNINSRGNRCRCFCCCIGCGAPFEFSYDQRDVHRTNTHIDSKPPQTRGQQTAVRHQHQR